MPKIFYGWWIIIASSIITTYNGGIMFYGFTAFFNPILNEFGWSRAATSLAFSLQRLEGGIAAPIVGYFIDRLGPRKMSLFAVTVFGTGFILLSKVNSLLSFYTAFIIISIGHSAGFYSVGATVVANWFVRKRGKAMGLVTGGVCLAGTLVPVLVWLINQYGWRQSLVIAGIGMWIIGIPLSFVFRNRPEEYGMLPDGDVARDEIKDNTKISSSTIQAQKSVNEAEFTAMEAIKTRSFWMLAVGLSISFMAMSAVFVHIMPFLESIGISREKAGYVVTLTIFLSVMGRIGLGWLSDYMDKRYVFCIADLLAYSFLPDNLQSWLRCSHSTAPGHPGRIFRKKALRYDSGAVIVSQHREFHDRTSLCRVDLRCYRKLSPGFSHLSRYPRSRHFSFPIDATSST